MTDTSIEWTRAAGRTLDGRTWDQFPRIAGGSP